MKGLYRYLSPFSPDQSGAVAVLYELGGIGTWMPSSVAMNGPSTKSAAPWKRSGTRTSSR